MNSRVSSSTRSMYILSHERTRTTGSPSTADGGDFAMGGTEEALRVKVLGVAARGDPAANQPFDRTTGKGWVGRGNLHPHMTMPTHSAAGRPSPSSPLRIPAPSLPSLPRSSVPSPPPLAAPTPMTPPSTALPVPLPHPSTLTTSPPSPHPSSSPMPSPSSTPPRTNSTS